MSARTLPLLMGLVGLTACDSSTLQGSSDTGATDSAGGDVVGCVFDTEAQVWTGVDEDGEDCVFDTEASGWSEESHAKGTDGDAERIFPQDAVLRLDIELTASTYDVLQDDLDALMEAAGFSQDGGGQPGGGEQPPEGGGGGGEPPEGGGGGAGGGPGSLAENPAYVPVTVSFDGKSWPSVGFRYKGNSSLWGVWQEGGTKLPFRLELDQYEDQAEELDNQRFWGFKELKFSSAYTDDSLIRDRLAATSFRDAGVPAARGGFVEVYVDAGEGPVYWGLYTAFEDPCGELLDDWFSDDEGNCYEAEDADLADLGEGDFDQKGGEDESQDDLQALVDVLADTSQADADWRAELEAHLDVDGFLRALALSTLIGNWDSYGLMGHNFYLYAAPHEDGALVDADGVSRRFVYIPWDFNMSYTRDSMQEPLDLDMDEVGEEWPLIRRLLDDEVYRAAYDAHVEDLLTGVFEVEAQQERMADWHALVADSAAAESGSYTNLPDTEAFEQSLEQASDSLFQRVDDAQDEGWRYLEGR